MDYIHYATYHPYLDMGQRYLPHPVATNKAFPHGVNLGTTGLPVRTPATRLLDMERANFPSKYERRADLDRMRSKRRVEDFSSIPRKSYSDYLRPTNPDRVYISPWSCVFPSYEIEDYYERPVRRVGLGLPGVWPGNCLRLRREDQDLDPLTIEIEAEQVRLNADKEAKTLQNAIWQSAVTDRVIRLCQERQRYRELEKRVENARLVAPIYQSPDSHLGIRQKVLINYHKGGGTDASSGGGGGGGGGGGVNYDSRPSPSPVAEMEDEVSARVTVPLKRQKTLEDLVAGEPEANATVVLGSDTRDEVVKQEAPQLLRSPSPQEAAAAASPKQVSIVDDDVDEERPTSPSKKSAKGKVPPKLSILKTKKSESFEDQPKTPTKVKTPRTPKTPILNESPALASPQPKTPKVRPESPLEQDVPKSAIEETRRSPSPPPTPRTPTSTSSHLPEKAKESKEDEEDVQQIRSNTPTTPLDMDDVTLPELATIEPEISESQTPLVIDSDREIELEEQRNDEDEEADAEKVPKEQENVEADDDRAMSPPAPPLKRLVSTVSTKDGDACDPEEWLDDDPPSIEYETDESRPKVILSASDVPSVLAKRMAEEEGDEESETEYAGRLSPQDIQMREPSNANVEVDVDQGTRSGPNLGSADRLNSELLSMSTQDNENAEAGSAITSDATEGTISANGRPLSVDAESLIADEEQQAAGDDGMDELNENEDPKMMAEDTDEMTLKSEEGYERTKSLSVEEHSDEE